MCLGFVKKRGMLAHKKTTRKFPGCFGWFVGRSNIAQQLFDVIQRNSSAAFFAIRPGGFFVKLDTADVGTL